MTPLQALETITALNKPVDESIYNEAINVLRQSLTPPTADEVCEALSKLPIYKNDTIIYDEKTKRFMGNNFAITDEEDIPIFILLGRFYEAQE